ncbi:MAG: phosphotransferase [Gammaproteobacteria bacterium]|nr:phosphotransferase [Gammaproteobacteria bacterium]
MITIGIVGNKGSGKTTFITRLISNLPASQLVLSIDHSQINDLKDSISNQESLILIEIDTLAFDQSIRDKLHMIIFIDLPLDICLCRLILRERDLGARYNENIIKTHLALDRSNLNSRLSELKCISDIIIDNNKLISDVDITEVLDFISESRSLPLSHRLKLECVNPTFDASLKPIKKGTLYVVSGPSGVGKTTIIKKVVEQIIDLERLVPYTTRKMRDNESEGNPYRFVDKEMFEKVVPKDDMLQRFTDYGEEYGIAASEVLTKLNSGISLIIDVSSKVLEQVRSIVPDLKSIYICPRKMVDIMERLTKRDGDQASTQQRYKKSVAELECASYKRYDYLIINADIDTAILELKSIITTNNLQITKQLLQNAKILETFNTHLKLERITRGLSIGLDLSNYEARPLSSLNNRSYQIVDRASQNSYFLRIAGQGDDPYRLSASEELAALTKAAALGIYPKLIRYDEENLTYIVPFLSYYRRLSVHELESEKFLVLALSALKNLHSSEKYTVDYLPIKYDEGVLYKMKRMGIPFSDDMDKISIICHRVSDVLEKTCHVKVPCNNDVSIYNILYCADDDVLVISDWECSGNNDPLWDLAKLSVESSFNEENDKKMLEHYYGSPVSALNYSRLILQKLLVEYHLAIWARLQSVTNDYSVSKYQFELIYAKRLDNCRKYLAFNQFEHHLLVVNAAAKQLHPDDYVHVPASRMNIGFFHRPSSLLKFCKKSELDTSVEKKLQNEDNLTLFIIKPDIPCRNKIGEVISFVEKQGFKVVTFKFKKLTTDDVDALYPHMKQERFDVLDLFTSGESVLVVLKTTDAAKKLRALKGSTDPANAQKDTLRGLFGSSIKWNAVHCSDDASAAIREIALFFSRAEIQETAQLTVTDIDPR